MAKKEKEEKYYIPYDNDSVEVPKIFYQLYYKTGIDIQKTPKKIKKLESKYSALRNKKNHTVRESELLNEYYDSIKREKKKLEKLKKLFESLEKEELPRYAFNQKNRPERHKAEIKLGKINPGDNFRNNKRILKIIAITAIASMIIPGSLPFLIGAGLVINNLRKAGKLKQKIKAEDLPYEFQEARRQSATMATQMPEMTVATNKSLGSTRGLGIRRPSSTAPSRQTAKPQRRP